MDHTQYDSLPIEIDEELQAIVPAFLEGRRADCRTIVQLLQAGQMDEIRTLGHRMKGAGGSYGFDEISEIGELIETAAVSADGEVIKKAVIRLEGYLSRVVIEYV